MKQIWIPRVGPPEVLTLQESPDPSPQEKEVRVRVEAIGVNFADLLLRQGSYPNGPALPAVPGFEVSGIVDALGTAVSDYKVGDRVSASGPQGAYTDVFIAKEEQCHLIPQNMSFHQALTIPVNYNTAHALIHEMARVREGEIVLVYAAAGGVGIAACDLLLALGAIPIGIASSSKHSVLRDRGVTRVLDLERDKLEEKILEWTHGKGVDVVLDSYGGDYWLRNLKLLAPMGRLLVFGYSSTLQKPLGTSRDSTKPWEVGNPLSLMASNYGILGVDLNSLWGENERVRRWTDKNLELFALGKIRPLIDRVFRLDEAAEAHHYLQARKNIGKVLLIP